MNTPQEYSEEGFRCHCMRTRLHIESVTKGVEGQPLFLFSCLKCGYSAWLSQEEMSYDEVDAVLATLLLNHRPEYVDTTQEVLP